MNTPVRTLDDISQEIEAIAFHGEGTDKLRALKMLQEARGVSSITLPEPMGDGEVIQRLSTVMKGAGHALCHIAYAKAFPNARGSVDDDPILKAQHLSPEIAIESQRIVSLKMLYKRFPGMKRSGVPTGYPSGRGGEVQRQWCRSMAARCLLDEQQRLLDQAPSEEKRQALRDAPIEVFPTAVPDDT